MIQRAFSNGWKSIHGLKHQTLDTAFGMTAHMYGPAPLRRNDLKLLRESELNQKFEQLQIGRPIQLKFYGDSIYPRLSLRHSSWRSNNLCQWQQEENRRYTKVRVSIEWNYMITGNLYGYVKKLNKLKILGSSNVSKVYTVATLLQNCHVAMYGSETSYYFNVFLPTHFLEKSMRVPGY